MSTTGPILDDAMFRPVVAPLAGPLLAVAGKLNTVAPNDTEHALAILTRPLLAVILSHASQLEELLDAYGALQNERWHHFRGVVAALKLFARTHYSLVHLANAAPFYHLRPVEGDLETALLQARRFTAKILQTANRRLVETALSLGLTPHPIEICEERLPAGSLPQDRALRHVADVAGTVARLATAFLNLAEEPCALDSGTRSSGRDAPLSTLPEETELRHLAENFHNLQALYDTHVAHTDVEQADPELRSLRGHASVVFHLFETATDLAHYYERHVLHVVPAHDSIHLLADDTHCGGPKRLESVLRDCTLAFAARYIFAGRALAQRLLRRYAEQGEITVPVPRYRGFHVRPSTLVARVAYHYGSPVSMILGDETYDAASPLELFRANEQINADKRRWLAQEVARLVDGARQTLEDDPLQAVRTVLMRLAEEAKVVLYEQPFPPIEGQLSQGQTVLSFLVDTIARLQALGKIDIVTPLTATFHGDRRVLADLRLLALNGYGEDAYGNNIALPDELSYLRR